MAARGSHLGRRTVHNGCYAWISEHNDLPHQQHGRGSFIVEHRLLRRSSQYGIEPLCERRTAGVPSLSDKRTLFNRSFLVSTNSLWKLENGELKANIDYSFNRVTADASNITTYFLPDVEQGGRDVSRPYDGNRVITENRSGTEHTHSLSGKFIYELNRRTAFINNTLRANVDWDDVDLVTSGSIPNEQSAKLPDYYVSNNFKMIKRFKGKPSCNAAERERMGITAADAYFDYGSRCCGRDVSRHYRQ